MTAKKKLPKGLPSDWEMLTRALAGRRLGPLEARAYLAGFHAGWMQGSFAQYINIEGGEALQTTLRRAYKEFEKAHPQATEGKA